MPSIYNQDDADSYDMPETEFDWANVPDQLPNEDANNATYEQYLTAAQSSGVDLPWLQTVKDAWKTGGKAVDSVSAWAKANPELASMVTAGIGNSQKQKLSNEQLELKRKWQLEDAATKKADEAELYDRRNQSIINTKPAQLGILGAGTYDKHLDYLKNRK